MLLNGLYNIDRDSQKMSPPFSFVFSQFRFIYTNFVSAMPVLQSILFLVAPLIKYGQMVVRCVHTTLVLSAISTKWECPFFSV